MLKKLKWPAAMACVGFLAGLGVAVMLLYKSSFVSRLDGLKQRLGFTSYWSTFGYGHDKDLGRVSWKAVTSPQHPRWKVRPGYDVELVASGFTYPVNIVFLPDTRDDPSAPRFYVNELHGTIRYVTNGGEVGLLAEGLTNFKPFPLDKSDERGLSGMALIPGTNDLLVTTSYEDEASGLLSNRILRVNTQDGGKSLGSVETVLDLKEFTSPSNQIQQVLVGPDGFVYVSVGDGENHQLSMQKGKFAGKILRMTLDGAACEENPFYDPANPDSPASYIFAYGLRNVFDFDFFELAEQPLLYGVDNGKNLDRLMRLERGGNYGWNGDYASIRMNALYTWGPEKNTAPVGLAIIKGSGLDNELFGRCCVALYGPVAIMGPNHAKSIVSFGIDPVTGLIAEGPDELVQYQGEGKSTVLGLAEGPDGLYFTDFFGESQGTEADGAGNVWRVVPSTETLGIPTLDEELLAELSPAERGQIRFRQHCMTCHRLDGSGGREGPELTHAVENLKRRLSSAPYLAEQERLLAREDAYYQEQKWRIEEVLQATEENRLRVWLKHHLEEPRFDNPHAKMPSFQLVPEQDRDEIIEFLLSR